MTDSVQFSTEITLFKKRWVMLALFSACNALNSFQWFQYSIIANIVVKYYGVSDMAVNWLSLIFMLSYLVLIFPTMLILDKKGLKLTVLLGILSMTVGSWIKIASVSPDRFYVTMIGQTVGSIAEAFLYRTPPRLAALWFGPDEVSTACAIGVVSSQLGSAFGFLIPSLIVDENAEIEDIAYDLKRLFYGFSIICTVLLVLVVIFFQSEPRTPPSAARATAITNQETDNFKKSIKKLMTNHGFVLLLLSNSLMSSAVDSANILLNQTILLKFNNQQQTPGRLGLGNICLGIVGAFLTGFWLDRYHKFKFSGVASCALYCLSLLGYTYSVYYTYLPMVYVSFILSGLFYGAYLTISYEFSAELTYPEPEGMMGGLLNIGTFILGIAVVNFGGWILVTYGDFWANYCFSVVAFVSLVLMVLIREHLRRKEAQKGTVNKTPSTENLK